MDRTSPAEALIFGTFRLDSGGLFRVDESGRAEPVPIGSRALELLLFLAERHGELVQKSSIMDAVWPGMVVEDNNLTVQISALRRILDRDRSGSCIQTVRGRGYRFVASVTRVAPTGVARRATLNESATGAGYSPTEIPAGSRRAMLRSSRYRFRPAVMAVVVAAFCIGGALVWRALSPGEDRLPPRLSIVVLPFANLSGDADLQHFIDSIAEDLTTELARAAHVHVISHSTALGFRDKPVDVKRIGISLGVRYVLEGGVQRLADRIRVNAQLIDAADDFHLWANIFDGDAESLSVVQNEITIRIAGNLSVTLDAIEAGRLPPRPNVTDLIIQGRAFWRKWPAFENYAKAIDAFERALQLDPHSAEAQAWLARVLVHRVLREQSGTPAADIVRAARLVDLSLTTSPLGWFPHYVKGQVLSVQNRCDAAIPEFERVIVLNGNFMSAYANLGWCKFLMGSIEEAIPLEERGIHTLTSDPFLGVLYWRIGVMRLVQSHIGEAIEMFEKARSINAKLVHPHAYLAAAYGLQGQIDLAAAELAEARRLSRDDRYSSISQLVATENFGVPKMQVLFAATYIAGLRRAGMLDEVPLTNDDGGPK